MSVLYRTWIIHEWLQNNSEIKIDIGERKWIPKWYGTCARGRLTYSQM